MSFSIYRILNLFNLGSNQSVVRSEPLSTPPNPSAHRPQDVYLAAPLPDPSISLPLQNNPAVRIHETHSTSTPNSHSSSAAALLGLGLVAYGVFTGGTGFALLGLGALLLGCADESSIPPPSDTCSGHRPSNISSGTIQSHPNYIEIQIPNTLRLPDGLYLLDTYYEVYREAWVGNRLLNRNLMTNILSHWIQIEGNRVLLGDRGSPEMPLQPGVYYRYSIRPKALLSSSESCNSSEALTLSIQRPGSYDPQNPGSHIRRNSRGESEAVCLTTTLPIPLPPQMTEARFYNFGFNLSWAGGPSRRITVQVNRSIRDLNEENAALVAEYVARQVQLAHEHLIQERGFQAFPFDHYLYRVFDQSQREVEHAGGFYNPEYIGLNMPNLSYPNSPRALSTMVLSDPVILHELGHHYTDFGPISFLFPSRTPGIYRFDEYFIEGIAKFLEQGITSRYQAILEFSVNPGEVQMRSQEALQCFLRVEECRQTNPIERQICCVTRHEGLRLFVDPSAPMEFQNLSLSLYSGILENEMLLRIRRENTGPQEFIRISMATLGSPNNFSCSDRLHEIGRDRLNLERNFGIGDACLTLNPRGSSQRQLILFNQDINPPSNLECGRENYRYNQSLTLHDGRSFQNLGSFSPYLPEYQPYDAGACFFRELEQLNPRRFRTMISLLQGNAGFSTCQSFDSIQWYANQMGVSSRVIEEMMQRYGFPNIEDLRRGRAVTYSPYRE